MPTLRTDWNERRDWQLHPTHPAVRKYNQGSIEGVWVCRCTGIYNYQNTQCRICGKEEPK